MDNPTAVLDAHLHPERRQARLRRAARPWLLAGLLAAVFLAGMLTQRSLTAGQLAANSRRQDNFYLPINSRALTVSIVPLRPSAKVEAVLRRTGSAQQTKAIELVTDPVQLAALRQTLETYYPCSYELAPPLELPDEAFDFERQQYRTSMLLPWLAGATPLRSFKSIGVTWADLYDGEYNFLFGQARLTGRSAVVSSARMGQPPFKAKTTEQRWQQIVAHELGHTFGLEHTDDRKSVMAFANSLEEHDSQGGELTRADWRTLEALHPVVWDTTNRAEH
jgi:predicted Zn-dependent protease